MIRIVADTNILVSAIMFGGLPGQFLDRVSRGDFKLIVSTSLLDELEETLSVKFNRPVEQLVSIKKGLLAVSEHVNPKIKIDAVPNDPDDNRVLECAVEGLADYIVSGDRHLLTLGSYQNISIMKVRDFMDRVGS